jgi:hypothetical protein
MNKHSDNIYKLNRLWRIKISNIYVGRPYISVRNLMSSLSRQLLPTAAFKKRPQIFICILLKKRTKILKNFSALFLIRHWPVLMASSKRKIFSEKWFFWNYFMTKIILRWNKWGPKNMHTKYCKFSTFGQHHVWIIKTEQKKIRYQIWEKA